MRPRRIFERRAFPGRARRVPGTANGDDAGDSMAAKRDSQPNYTPPRSCGRRVSADNNHKAPGGIIP